MVHFSTLDITDEESIEELLQSIDMAIQVRMQLGGSSGTLLALGQWQGEASGGRAGSSRLTGLLVLGVGAGKASVAGFGAAAHS